MKRKMRTVLSEMIVSCDEGDCSPHDLLAYIIASKLDRIKSSQISETG